MSLPVFPDWLPFFRKFVLRPFAYKKGRHIIMKHRLFIFIIAAFCSIIAASCAKDPNAVIGIVDLGGGSDDLSFIPSSSNTMTVKINGATKLYSCYAFWYTIFGDSSLFIVGAAASDGVGIGTLGINSIGKYNVGSADTSLSQVRTVIMTYEYVAPGNDTVKYAAESTSGSQTAGTLTITQLTSTNVKAAFHATLTKQSGIAGGQTMTLTSGGINAALQ
jgi:hypothetical protein